LAAAAAVNKKQPLFVPRFSLWGILKGGPKAKNAGRFGRFRVRGCKAGKSIRFDKFVDIVLRVRHILPLSFP